MIIKTISTHFDSKSVIVDNEISNDISVSFGDWKYEEGNIICCAVLYENKIICILKEKEDSEESYKEELKKLLDKFVVMYAFNKNMEYGNFKGFLKKDYNIQEIKAFKGKGKSKEWFFQELLKDKIINEIPFDPLEDNSKEVLNCYEKEDYNSIIQHNIADVIKQYWILKNRDYFIDKYKERINKDGWFE